MKPTCLCKILFICVAPTLPLFGQLGDSKDKRGDEQVDPIPTDQIPPSPWLELEEALRSFKLAPGYVIESVAPEHNVHMAVALAFDGNGRVWTAEMRGYMPNLDAEGEDTPNGRIRVLEDMDGDGTYESATTFLDGLVLPRAVAVTHDGCLYTSGDVLYFIERDGLKPVGGPVVVDDGYARGGNPEHKANGLLYGHDNWYYSAKSNRRYRRIDGKWVRGETDNRGQWGIAKDDHGRLLYNNNSILLTGDPFVPDLFRGNPNYTPAAMPGQNIGSNRVYPIRITPGVNRAYREGILDEEGKLKNATAASGMTIYRGQNFPEKMQGMAFVTEPSAEVVKAIHIERDKWNRPKGDHPFGKVEFLASTDEWFLPCNAYTAPDGSLWIIDMYFGLLQHKAYMTTYLRKQYKSRNLDKPGPSTGRIYRIRYAEKPLAKVPKMEGRSPEELVPHLAHPNGTVRDTAQRLLVEYGDRLVLPKLGELIADKQQPLGQIHALWTLQGLGHGSKGDFITALKSPDHNVVRAALHVLAELQPPFAMELGPVFKELPWQPQYLHALVRALAANGMADQALIVVLENPEAPLLREALISGLGKEAAAFKAKHTDIKDGALVEHLAKATQKAPKQMMPDGAHLEGEALAAFKRGEQHYVGMAACYGCHGEKGEGIPNLGPPLAKSEWVTGDAVRLAKILLHGMSGPVKVNGQVYKPIAAMPGLKDNSALSDAHLADVMTYIRNAWGNKAEPVEAPVVKKVRAETSKRLEAYTDEELR